MTKRQPAKNDSMLQNIWEELRKEIEQELSHISWLEQDEEVDDEETQ